MLRKLLACAGIVLLLMIGGLPVAAASGSASLSGPGTLRPGDSITINLNVSGSSLYAVQGTLNYDSAQLTYQGSSGFLAGWAVDIEHTRGSLTFLGIDDRLATPITSSSRLFRLTFTVSSQATPGSTIRVSASDLKASDGVDDFPLGSTAYSQTVSAPLSGNNRLQTLVVRQADLSPSFTATTTNYTAKVPYSVSRLEISAAAEDTAARVSISDQALRVGNNTIEIRVTAASGAVRVYTLVVTREQDPDYVASSDARLGRLSAEPGILSPAFDPERSHYVVYLPYEMTVFQASGEPADRKARGIRNPEINLKVGENLYELISIAEDGTEKAYQITVLRMPEWTAETTETEPTATVTPTPTITVSPTPAATEQAISETTDLTVIQAAGPDPGGSSLGMLILVSLLSLAAGAALMYGFMIRKSRR